MMKSYSLTICYLINFLLTFDLLCIYLHALVVDLEGGCPPSLTQPGAFGSSTDPAQCGKAYPEQPSMSLHFVGNRNSLLLSSNSKYSTRTSKTNYFINEISCVK